MENIKNKRKRVIFLMIIVALLIFSIWTFTVRPVESKTLDVEFSVGATSGVNVDTDKLYFGRIIPGGSAERRIRIENGYHFPVKLKISASKEIAEYIVIDKEYIAEPGKETAVPITLVVPVDTPYGNYTGKIKFDLLRV